MLRLGTLKSFDSTDYRAEVQLAGSMSAYLDNIPVARNIAASQMEIGRHVILAIPQGIPKDACVIAVWDGGAGGSGGIEALGDIGDVNLPAPADADFLYWNNANNRWECRPLAEPDIPAAIARDAEVDADITAHATDPDAHHAQDHHARHEDGGADEVSVAGLSGELADPQPSNFLKLSDTPAAFAGQAGKYPKVNVGEDGLEFAAGGGGASDYLTLTDTPAAFADKAYKFPRVDSAENALEFERVGDWVLPTANNDPDSHWTDEVKAYDKDTGTYAYEGALAIGWNSYIEFSHSAVDCDKVRVYADYNAAWGVDSIDIDVYYSGAWHDVYEGAITGGAWVVKDIPDGEQSVTQMRIRYSHTDLAYGMRIFEASFWQVGLAVAAGGGGGVTDHGALTGLADDDHAQYLKEKASGGLAAEIPDHASNHQLGGADEIDLTDLPGTPMEAFPFRSLSFAEPFRNLDAWTQHNAGSGSVTCNLLNLELATGATINSRAAVYLSTDCINHPHYHNARTYIHIRSIGSLADSKVWLYRLRKLETKPPTDIGKHGGFKIINGEIWATNADGTTEKATDTGEDFDIAGELNLLECRGDDSNIYFYVGGELEATHNINLPTNWSYCLYLGLTNTVAANKQVRIYFVNVRT